MKRVFIFLLIIVFGISIFSYEQLASNEGSPSFAYELLEDIDTAEAQDSDDDKKDKFFFQASFYKIIFSFLAIATFEKNYTYTRYHNLLKPPIFS